VCTAGLEGLGENVVAVIIIDNHEVLIPFAGGDGEAAGLVTVI
jgi:hypothetical protein